MKEAQANVKYHNKARAKETGMFVFACVILTLSIIFLMLPTGFAAGNVSDTSVEQTMPGAEVVATMVVLHVFMVIGIILIVALIVCWIAGLVVSIKLVARKKVLPRWMYISSIVLTSCYSMLILTLALLWIVM